MSLGQYANFNRDRAHGAVVASVDTGFAVQDALANNVLLKLGKDTGNVVGTELTAFTSQAGNRLLAQFADLAVTLHLVGDAVGVAQSGFVAFSNSGHQRGIFFRRRPLPLGLADFSGQLIDNFDNGLHFLVGVQYTAQHLVFGQLGGFGFNHQYRLLGTGYHHVQLAAFQL